MKNGGDRVHIFMKYSFDWVWLSGRASDWHTKGFRFRSWALWLERSGRKWYVRPLPETLGGSANQSRHH